MNDIVKTDSELSAITIDPQKWGSYKKSDDLLKKIINCLFYNAKITVWEKEEIFFPENFCSHSNYKLFYKPSFFTDEIASDKWCSGEYLEEVCDKFCVEYNDDVDCFIVSFKRPRDLMKSLNKMFRLIRFLLEENKKQKEHKENIQNGFGERNDMV